jgi:hypothetical protein
VPESARGVRRGKGLKSDKISNVTSNIRLDLVWITAGPTGCLCFYGTKHISKKGLESVESLDKFLGVGQDGDEVGLGNWCREPDGFSSWPSKRKAG